MRVIVAGGRDFEDYAMLRACLEFTLEPDDEIVSGTAKGADTLGERYAKEYDVPLHKFPAEWERHGKAAGPIRNRQMAEYGDKLVAFLTENKLAGGTKDMIIEALKKGLEVHVYRY
ncbi:MAG: DUF2493 domain-containing protein [Nitrosopumilus sp.]